MAKLITAKELIETALDEIPMLVDPLIPKNSLTAIIGSSASGKSSFARQLAFSICNGDEEFLGFKLHHDSKRVLYVSTEEDETNVGPILKQQFVGSDSESLEKLEFLFPTTGKISNHIKRYLERSSYDLIIIDSFSDIITGDMNMSNVIRQQLNVFRDLASRYKVSIMFIHHITKQSENQSPSKLHSMGSSGFEQKMRFVGELTADSPEQRSLHCVKGNYLTPEDSGKVIVLKVNSNRNVEKTGEFYIPISANNTSRRGEWKVRANQLYDNDDIKSISDLHKALETDGFTIARATVGKHFVGKFPKSDN